MKVETTVTLSEDLVEALERRTQGPEGRSAIVEAALRAYLASPRRGEPALLARSGERQDHQLPLGGAQ